MTHRSRPVTLLASLTCCAALVSCGSSTAEPASEETSSPSSQPSSTSEPTEPSESSESSASPATDAQEATPAAPERQRFTVATPTYRLTSTVTTATALRHDGAYAGRLHLLPTSSLDAASGPWADLFVYSPTEVHHPENQRLVPLPVDPVTWLSSNPRVRLLSTRTYRVGGAQARELNVQRDGSPLFGGDRSDDAPGGLERYIFVRRGQRWLVGQASTFEGQQALERRAGPGDLLLALVRNARLTERD
jgi:hypothetical protein